MLRGRCGFTPSYVLSSTFITFIAFIIVWPGTRLTQGGEIVTPEAFFSSSTQTHAWSTSPYHTFWNSAVCHACDRRRYLWHLCPRIPKCWIAETVVHEHESEFVGLVEDVVIDYIDCDGRRSTRCRSVVIAYILFLPTRTYFDARLTDVQKHRQDHTNASNGKVYCWLKPE